MHPQLELIREELQSAQQRVTELSSGYHVEAWLRRPGPASWSAAECVAHLNITSEAYLKLLPEAIERARASANTGAPARFRLDLPGWLILQAAGRRRRFASRTPTSFEPGPHLDRDGLLSDFAQFQDRLSGIVAAADGLPLNRIRMVSPFSDRVRYSVYSALRLIPEHQHRHLDQAERALQAGAR